MSWVKSNYPSHLQPCQWTTHQRQKRQKGHRPMIYSGGIASFSPLWRHQFLLLKIKSLPVESWQRQGTSIHSHPWGSSTSSQKWLLKTRWEQGKYLSSNQFWRIRKHSRPKLQVVSAHRESLGKPHVSSYACPFPNRIKNNWVSNRRKSSVIRWVSVMISA